MEIKIKKKRKQFIHINGLRLRFDQTSSSSGMKLNERAKSLRSIVEREQHFKRNLHPSILSRLLHAKC